MKSTHMFPIPFGITEAIENVVSDAITNGVEPEDFRHACGVAWRTELLRRAEQAFKVLRA